MDIPYTIKARPDTGLYNAKLGIWLFLASEVMLFGALFSTYVLLRTAAPIWPPPSPHTPDGASGMTILNVPLATLNTMILIASSVTMVLAWASLKMKRLGGFRLHMGLTLLLSLARHVPQATASMKAGRWEKKKFTGMEIYNRTLGLLGIGNIGRIVALRAQGLGMKVIAFDPYIAHDATAKLNVELVSLDELLSRAD